MLIYKRIVKGLLNLFKKKCRRDFFILRDEFVNKLYSSFMYVNIMISVRNYLF